MGSSLKNHSQPPLRSLPRVVIDARMVSQIQHGISRYVSHLAQGLEKLRSTLPYEPVFLVNSEFFSRLKEKSGGQFYSFQTYPTQTDFLNPKELIEIPAILRKLQADLYHSPSFSSLWNCPCPSLITLHDLNHLTYGDFKKKVYYQFLLRRFAKKSEKILTVSKFSRKEISKWLNLPLDSIEIVYNSLSEDQAQLNPNLSSNQNSVLERNNLITKKYFFCLSNSKPHKNISLLIDSYCSYQKQTQNPWPLVISTEPIKSIPGIIYVHGLQENDAQILLKNAGGMLFPSLYEGFGLPPIEAALLQTPIAVSQIPPHQEGLVDLAPSEVHWVNPKDIHGWTSSFHRLQRGEVCPASEASRQKILSRFSIEKMGNRMNEIYSKLIQKKEEK